MINLIVELYGLAAELACREEAVLELPGETAGIPELVSALKSELPELDGVVLKKGENRLSDGYLFNIDGRFYSGSDNIILNDGDKIRLLTAATGG